jgi:hypothetical protein
MAQDNVVVGGRWWVVETNLVLSFGPYQANQHNIPGEVEKLHNGRVTFEKDKHPLTM